jgi:hypothetical protein
MRIVLTLLLALLATPAFAQSWEVYENSRFGYSLDIPPGFQAQSESDNGDGLTFAAEGKAAYLLVWGGNLLGDFEAEVSRRIEGEADEAWNVSYQAVTPQWASWSAVKGSRMVYQRMTLLCDGTSYGAFRAEYSVTDSTEMDGLIEQMVTSLRGNC